MLHKLFPTVFLITAVCFGFQAKDTTPSVKTPLAEKSAATVEQMKGLYVFVDCKPVRTYKYLGNVKGKVLSMNPQYTNLRDALLKRTSIEYPTADGVILHLNSGGFDFADAIKFE